MRKKNRQIDLLRMIALLLVFFIIIYAWLFIFMPWKIPPCATFMVPESKLNILIIGKDYSYDEFRNKVDRNHSDTLIFVQVNPFTNKVLLISLPRDSYVDIPGCGKRKINEAYWMGKEALAKQTVSELLKTGIHGIITVDPKGLIKLVDSLGGVNLYVEKNMKYDDNWGDLHIDLKKGRQKLSGKDFEGYVRFRHDSDGDVARVQRQQTALRQVLKKLSSPAALVRLPWMIPALKTAVKTDISFPDLLRIANFSRTLDPSNIRTFTLPGYTKEGDPHWYVDLEQTHKVLQENKII